MKIEVTQEDIRNGLKANPCECPIAIACHRAFPDAERLRVQLLEVFVGNAAYDLPDIARAFIKDFDSHFPVQPFTFDLE